MIAGTRYCSAVSVRVVAALSKIKKVMSILSASALPIVNADRAVFAKSPEEGACLSSEGEGKADADRRK